MTGNRAVRLCVVILLLLLTASAQTPEEALLGGPCLAESGADIASIRAWHENISRQMQASRRGDRDSAFALAKQVVRGSCSNEYWWFRLAEAAIEAKHPEEATIALSFMRSRGINGILDRLADPTSLLHALQATAAYRNSSVAVQLEHDRRNVAERRAKARARLPRAPHPADAYVAKRACPFECCRFGAWLTVKPADLYDSPNGTRLIGRVSKGVRVQALTGEVHLRPRPVLVRFAGPAPEGTIVYLLDYLGEGSAHIWSNRKVSVAEVSVRSECTSPGPSCWGEFVYPQDSTWARDAVWWVKVKTPDLPVGWTRWSGQFRGADACE